MNTATNTTQGEEDMVARLQMSVKRRKMSTGKEGSAAVRWVPDLGSKVTLVVRERRMYNIIRNLTSFMVMTTLLP